MCGNILELRGKRKFSTSLNDKAKDLGNERDTSFGRLDSIVK